jgi:MarR family transcriptional regulator, transcriptional regulator for hemolysin
VEHPRGRLLLDLYASQQLVGALLSRELGADGVPRELYGLLTEIALAGPVAPTKLAALLGLPPTTLYDYADRLVERGHVVRRPNPADGRSHLLEVTPEGRAVVRQGGAAVTRVVQALAGRLEETDLEQLEDAMHTLRSALEETAAAEIAFDR